MIEFDNMRLGEQFFALSYMHVHVLYISEINESKIEFKESGTAEVFCVIPRKKGGCINNITRKRTDTKLRLCELTKESLDAIRVIYKYTLDRINVTISGTTLALMKIKNEEPMLVLGSYESDIDAINNGKVTIVRGFGNNYFKCSINGDIDTFTHVVPIDSNMVVMTEEL